MHTLYTKHPLIQPIICQAFWGSLATFRCSLEPDGSIQRAVAQDVDKRYCICACCQKLASHGIPSQSSHNDTAPDAWSKWQDRSAQKMEDGLPY